MFTDIHAEGMLDDGLSRQPKERAEEKSNLLICHVHYPGHLDLPPTLSINKAKVWITVARHPNQLLAYE